MSLPRSHHGTAPASECRDPPPLRLSNPGPEPRTATVLFREGADPTAFLVRVEAGDTVTVPLPDFDEPTTVECHLDAGDASAVVCVDPSDTDGPILCLRHSTVCVAR